MFVTGKGGVGKTSVAAALALLAASHGKRSLVCEDDAKGDLAFAFEADRLRFKPRELQPNVWAMAMDTEQSLREYLNLQLHLPLVGRIGPLARSLDFVANAAPGVKEILTVGKLCYEVRRASYDLVVVDAEASGHIAAQLAAPETIAGLVQVGVVREQTRWMLDLLNDPVQTGVVIVTNPEEMPVAEAIELAATLRTNTSVDLAAVVVNRVLPELFGRGEEVLFERLREPGPEAKLAESVGASASFVLDAAELAVRLRRTGAAHLATLREQLVPPSPLLYVPELFARAKGLRATTQIARALGEELGY
ncbi:MAG TPA: ArsA family ATPase [Acidimicrobiales bacterium]|nr:ArsA family ATPase [Acidimicrobiales bacterium]